MIQQLIRGKSWSFGSVTSTDLGGRLEAGPSEIYTWGPTYPLEKKVPTLIINNMVINDHSNIVDIFFSGHKA